MNKENILEIGKIDSEILDKIVLKKIDNKNNDVISKGAIGDDCATIKIGDNILSISTDPITASINDIGKLAINISCNDIATRGISPIGITLSIMLPENSKVKDLEKIMDDAIKESKKVGVDIVGGHTEVTKSVNQPIIVSTAFGIEQLKNNETASVGDVIIMTKGIGLEGAYILVKDKEELKTILTQNEINKIHSFGDRLSVVEDGKIASKVGFIKMHDVTEGGILGGIWEVCEFLNLGCLIEKEKIIIHPLVEKVCSYFNANPYKMISSGCMLIVASKEKKDEMLKALKDSNIEADVIGELRAKEFGKVILENHSANIVEQYIEKPYKDEIYNCL